MAVNTRVINASPEQIFAVLADGWLFPAWVVGASRMRAVDANWPHVGSHLQHSFGAWPLVLDDTTTSLQWNPPHRFVIRPKGWPLGEAEVTLEVKPHRRGTLVRMAEDAVQGPGTLVPKPAMWLLLRIRNHEALKRLGYLAEGGAGVSLETAAVATERDRREPPKRRHPLRTAALIVAGVLVAGVGAVAVVGVREARR
ncbi:SRPBCC family protein [Microbacteriaceae bacterium VKM Ac-2855]|nr:SRPBCC family protein [Microbacteriaceae bacterium VKM Ac-2855]